MLHYAIAVVYKNQASRLAKAAAKREVAKHQLARPPGEPSKITDDICRELSLLPAVQRVVITAVTEHNVGTWEKGQRR